MSGIATGHFFRDQNILLLERDELLSGATGNNAGFLISGFGEHFYRTANRCGIERACEIHRIHLESHRMIHELTNRTERCGSLTVGASQKEEQELRISFEWMKANGFSVNWLEQPSTGLREAKPAMLNQDDGLIDSKSFWLDLSQNFPSKTNSAVIKVEERPNFLRVVTDREEYQTKRVVYCLNAFSSGLLPELKGRIIPLRGQMLELQHSGAELGRQPVIADYGEIYWNFTENTLRLGGLEYKVPSKEVGIASEISEEILEIQMQWVRANLKIEFQSHPMKTWCSTMAFTVDGFPFVGELRGRPNQYVLAGMCGLGHSYAMIGAFWLCELIRNDKNMIPAYFSSDRIWNLPEYTGGDWRSLYEAWNH